MSRCPSTDSLTHTKLYIGALGEWRQPARPPSSLTLTMHPPILPILSRTLAVRTLAGALVARLRARCGNIRCPIPLWWQLYSVTLAASSCLTFQRTLALPFTLRTCGVTLNGLSPPHGFSPRHGFSPPNGVEGSPSEAELAPALIGGGADRDANHIEDDADSNAEANGDRL